MKDLRFGVGRGTRPKHPIIDIRGLVLIYFLLALLAVLLSRSFFSDILQGGAIPETRVLIAFFTVPAVLLVFLVISGARVLRNYLGHRTGSRFEAKLLIFFVIITVLAASPVVMITNLAVGELLRFWKTINVDAALSEAERFAMENYSLNLEKLETLVLKGAFSAPLPPKPDLPKDVLAIQDFTGPRGGRVSVGFTGRETEMLDLPPGESPGFVPRELPRDANVIRYIIYPADDTLRVISWNLGDNFNTALNAIESERVRFAVIDSIRFNIRRLLIFYYGVFFLPALLMTLIIALSFARRITLPITELAEATHRVAEGDFSIQILPRKGDELALLISSFNAMVRDLEKSRAALVKAEKISIWQTMAQQLAHEIKNPLTPIRLSAERVLRRWQNEPERIGEIIESSMLAIIQETEGLAALLTEFRTLSKPSEPSLEWTDLLSITQEVIMPYGSSHPDIKFDISNILPGISLKIDKHRLAQVLTNLIINSIDAMPGSGLIEIYADLVKKRESRYCRLSIRDSGRGMSKEDSQKIFTPYFTTKKSGTGLGLPIVERIISDHGGSIWFNTALGAGTTFYIDLPLLTA